MTILILGCGYTGKRVARLLEARGHRVLAPPRAAIEAGHVPPPEPGTRILHSVPVPCARRFASLFSAADRAVYFSTTGVYGDVLHVDEHTRPSPRNTREHTRLDEECAVTELNARPLILRPAAIYGPGRGVHISLAEGKHRWWGDGANYISRIHVDDLAALTAAALISNVTGAYPVADAEPCTAIEMTRFCADWLNIPIPPAQEGLPPEDTRRSNRRVDGSAIRRVLGIGLRYPSYRSGIPASIDEGEAVRP